MPKKATKRNPIPIQTNATHMAGRTTAFANRREAIIASGSETPSATMARVTTRAAASGRCVSRTTRAQT